MNDQLERIWRRVLLSIGRGRIKTVSDGGNVQMLQVQLGADEIKDLTPRLAEYGFQSSPPPDSDAVLLFIAGERSNGVVIACGNKTFRMKGLATGEVAISDNKGQSVYLSASGIRVNGGGLPITITNAPSVTMDSPTVHCTGTLNVDGAITSGGNITAAGNVADQGGAKTMAGMRAIYNPHTHVPGPGTTPGM